MGQHVADLRLHQRRGAAAAARVISGWRREGHGPERSRPGATGHGGGGVSCLGWKGEEQRRLLTRSIGLPSTGARDLAMGRQDDWGASRLLTTGRWWRDRGGQMTVAAARKVYGHGKKKKKDVWCDVWFCGKKIKKREQGQMKKRGWAGDERLMRFYPNCKKRGWAGDERLMRFYPNCI
ncbi:hypothetical protein GQ55_1G300100 [Panicum hallii var. hallii]|uniref:Uncharacterized protein n=1 Tax=Panicum hallii var. hallii TaxID=1504633 RepID=A0A2T7F902_9POAL|nr:hypothetical protein GQ55_1G300100 [Panicum hallii var. hallii]